VQWTLTTKGISIKDLPFVGGLCVAQWMLTMKVSKNANEPQQQMMQPVTNRVREDRNNGQTTNICSKTERWDGRNTTSYYFTFEDFACMDVG
jgi:hypothetical protein